MTQEVKGFFFLFHINPNYININCIYSSLQCVYICRFLDIQASYVLLITAFYDEVLFTAVCVPC